MTGKVQVLTNLSKEHLELVKRRDEIMKIADKALDAVWPERQGDDFVHTMRWAVGELETITAEMRRSNVNSVEQSRTYRLMGSLYSDLKPALGKEMLLEAKKCFQTA